MSLYREPISVNEAVYKIIKETTLRMDAKKIKIQDAYGHVIAEPIIAKHDVPPFNRSAFDGYAIRAKDSEGASIAKKTEFTVIGTIGAGDVAKKPLEPYESYRIMTGAILPENADAIVMLEETEATEKGFTITKP